MTEGCCPACGGVNTLAGRGLGSLPTFRRRDSAEEVPCEGPYKRRKLVPPLGRITMLRTLAIVAALAFTASAASAQTIDAKGKCHDAKGKFAAMSVCKPSTPKAPQCKKGKLCGNSCIAVKDVCHK